MDSTIHNAITRAIWKTTKGRTDAGFDSTRVVHEMDRGALAELMRWKAGIAAEFSFLDDNIAFDIEQPNLRKFYADLNYYEWLKGIDRHDQMMGIEKQRRDAMQRVVDTHPEWEGNPHRKASDILGL